ncbi:MAG: GNAT family N-acetyltransferase [Actinomycetota bacterium]|nr:GNAT family N-acetyltransferase [Actinomycetota bacterium]
MSTEPNDATSRTRSEYRLDDSSAVRPRAAAIGSVRSVGRDDREALAALMLAAYRGTIDDEGEGDAEALEAIDHYFATMEWQHSVVCEHDDRLVAMSFVVVVDGRHYIDPVATAASHKGQGLGTAIVTVSLRSLADAGITEVGATITDGNTASERLFTGLGFVRVGTWG